MTRIKRKREYKDRLLKWLFMKEEARENAESLCMALF